MTALEAQPSFQREPASIEPMWLGTGDRAAFAILHRVVPTPEQAVLICPPFGWGEACSYRDLRRWAQSLARAGVACARIWPPGVGDAGGIPAGDQLGQWTSAIAEAAQWLRATSGAERIIALGIGLGGMLACQAAQEGAAIDDFILWSVPSRGRTLLRHERLHAGVVTAVSAEPLDVDLEDGRGLQLAGYRLRAESADALRRLELHPEAMPARPGRRVLLLGRDGLAADRSVHERFVTAGVDVTMADGDDWSDLIGPPQKSVPPVATISRTIEWIQAGERDSGAAHTNRPRTEALPPPRRLHAGPSTLVDGEGAVRERVMRFTGELEDCFAIVSEPVARPALPLTAVWLSPHHVGPSRMWVEVARRWAARGVCTVRLDLTGQGESGGASPRPLPDRFLYASQRSDYLPQVIEQLAEQGYGPGFILGGYCAGAYWALRAALEDARVRAAVLLNLYVFSYSDELLDERLSAAALEDLGARGWQRLRARRLSAAQVRRGLRTLRSAHRAVGRPHERQLRRESARILDELEERGVQMQLVLCQGESLLAQLDAQGPLDRWPHLTVDRLPTHDHYMWQLDIQAMVHASVDRALERALGESA